MLTAMASADDRVSADASEWSEAVAETVKRLLRESRKSRRWLAKQMGIDPATVTRLLGREDEGEAADRSQWTLDYLARAATALGVPRRQILAQVGFFEDNGPDAPINLSDWPPNVRELVEFVIREFVERSADNRPDGSEGVA